MSLRIRKHLWILTCAVAKTSALENAVGMVAERIPGEGYDCISELHNSRRIGPR